MKNMWGMNFLKRAAAFVLLCASTAFAQSKQPNIVFIMGDDIGWFNIGAYNQGMMAAATISTR